MINVTKTILPPLEEYIVYLQGIWERGHVTNHGPLVLELENKLKQYLDVPYFYFLCNGTIALQIAIKALDLKGEIITTPFSYVATTSSIVWENATPVFVDIDPATLTIDTRKIEKAITKKTTAILATHVYGIPCDVEEIAKIATKHNLSVIYDAAHAFGVKYKGKSILNYGDISTLSFHATKLFHTIEGGGVITGNAELAHKLSYLRNFGHNGPEEFWGLGINGKNSEFNAAMGLCLLPKMDEIISKRKMICEAYDDYFRAKDTPVERPKIPLETSYNYAYYPILFTSENSLLKTKEKLGENNIFPRRYFYPSLNKLPYLNQKADVPISESIAKRVMCLPLYPDLAENDVERIADIITKTLKNQMEVYK